MNNWDSKACQQVEKDLTVDKFYVDENKFVTFLRKVSELHSTEDLDFKKGEELKQQLNKAVNDYLSNKEKLHSIPF